MDTPALPVILRDFDTSQDLPDALDMWTQGIIDHTRTELLEGGQVRPIIYFLAPHPQDPLRVVEGIFPLWFFAGDASSKDFGCDVALQILAELKAYTCVTAIEAWVTRVRISGGTNERGEALLFMRETVSGLQTIEIAFTRDAEGKPVLGDQIPMEGEACGRFTEFLSGAREARKSAQT